MEQRRSYKVRVALQLIVSAILIVVAILILLNRQYVVDSIALSRYEPPTEIKALRDKTSLTELGERYFYVSSPEINDATEFNSNCKAHGEQSIILGCYAAGKIYLFNVQDERLAGIKEVTAAHEMLHAAYERLSEKEKQDVHRLLDVQAAQVTDERILGLIDLYEKREPEHILNELHSIFATELPVLSPELEEYYSLYFNDRQKVVAYSQEYEGVFTSIETRQKEILAELESLASVIQQRSEDLNTQSSQLSRDITAYNTRADTPGGFRTQEQADEQRESLIARRSALQAERAAILQLIDQARILEDEYKTLMGELESLNTIIDSTPEELPSI